jgi:hypothetical protein
MWVRGWMGVPVCVFVRVFVYACVSGVWVNGCARVRICALYVRMYIQMTDLTKAFVFAEMQQLCMYACVSVCVDMHVARHVC